MKRAATRKVAALQEGTRVSAYSFGIGMAGRAPALPFIA